MERGYTQDARDIFDDVVQMYNELSFNHFYGYPIVVYSSISRASAQLKVMLW